MASSSAMTLDDYLAGPEDLRRRDLVWGMVRDAPAPMFGHQSVVTRTTVLLDLHVRPRQLGLVCVSPIDVILDEEKALVVQPDVVFVSWARASIIRDQIWGAPDLVVEVTSKRTARHDRSVKLGWYRKYGVRECWLLDEKTITVVSLQADGERTSRFEGSMTVTSVVLPDFDTPAATFFAD